MREGGLELALRNLLQRHGYDSLEAVRAEEARSALRRVLARRGFTPTAGEEARHAACVDRAALDAWVDAAVTAASAAEALG